MGLLQRYCNQSLLLSRLEELKAIPGVRPLEQQRARPQMKRARQLRPAEIKALVADYQSGAGVAELAVKYVIHRSTVGKHLDEQGVVRRVRGLHPEDVPLAADLYRQGWSLARLSKKFGTTDNTVRARLLEAGVRMRDTHGRDQ